MRCSAYPSRMRAWRISRTTRVVTLTSGALVAGTLVASPMTHAAEGCTATSPGLDHATTCSLAGSQTITVPAGANAVHVVLIGGGGAGGTSINRGAEANPPGADGGAGAEVRASFRIEPGASVSIQVGAGGAAGFSGRGGQASTLTSGGTLLAVAGGGGGGGATSRAVQGGRGGSGAADATAAGGNGQDADGLAGNGGVGGADGNGGAVGSGGNGTAGASWSEGGAGGEGSTYGRGSPRMDSGGGGSGYGGGGGGGGAGETLNAFPGGGAGGSFANPDALIGAATFGPARGTAGAGGDGAPGGWGTRGGPGADGSLQLTFFIEGTTSQDFTLPRPSVQLIGVGATGPCADISNAHHDWRSLAQGGWRQSLAQWLRGSACARPSLYYPTVAGSQYAR